MEYPRLIGRIGYVSVSTVLLASAWFYACGDDPVDSPTVDAGISMSPDASGTLPDADVPATPQAACEEMERARCYRVNECAKAALAWLNGSLGSQQATPPDFRIDRCLATAAKACPEVRFSAGSNWTVEKASACTKALRTQTCDDLGSSSFFQVEPKECGVPGQYGTDAGCDFASQCGSSQCTNHPGPPVAEAEDAAACGRFCAASTLCNGGAACTSGTKCCGVGAQCEAGVSCVPNSPPAVAAGGACDPVAAAPGCAVESPCLKPDRAATAGTCQKLPALGQPCAFDKDNNAVCALGAACVRTDPDSLVEVGVCKAGIAQQYCSSLSNNDCGPGLICRATPNSKRSRCLPAVPKKLNESCSSQTDQCEPNTVCATSICVRQPVIGETCSAGIPCVTGATCVGGVCRKNPVSLGEPCFSGECDVGLECAGSNDAGRTCVRLKGCTP